MAAADAEQYGFVVEWFDRQAEIMREYQLTAFVIKREPMEVAMYDPKSKRAFLKRMPVADLTLDDLYMGGTVALHGRQLKVKGYLDARTEQALEQGRDSFAMLILPAAFQQLGHVLSAVEGSGFRVCKLRLVNDNGPTVALEVFGTPDRSRWDQLTQKFPPGYVQQVSSAAPYFEDKQRFPGTSAGNNCTLCVIRPHAMKAGNAGAIVNAIFEAGFEISAAQLLHLQRIQAAELFDVYKGVLPYQSEMVDAMCAAPCLALELRCPDNVVEKFRDLCGPHDVDMAKHIRPNSLRARFGLDNAQNGVHSTDLEDDGESEVHYVFGTLLGDGN